MSKKSKKLSEIKFGRWANVLLLSLLAVAITVGGFLFVQLTNPYAITVDGKEVVYVADKAAGEKVVRTIMEDYATDGAKVKSISLDKKISTERVMLWDDIDDKKLMKPKQAVEYIKAKNEVEDKDDALFTATIVGKTKGEEEYIPEVVYKKDDTMFAGDTEVEKEGKAGTQNVTREITTVNGEETENKQWQNSQ